MANNAFEIGSMAPADVYQTVIDKGLSPSEAASFVGEWILVATGKTKRVFGYKQSFDATEPACASTFARTFSHDDWVDGESVVQASETPGEVGFNERFHRIEADLDALSANVAKAFTCMAEMRSALASLLEEIRVEINRINTDIDNCCNQSTGSSSVLPGQVGAGAFLGKFKVQEKDMQLWNTKNGMILLPDIETMEGAAWTQSRTERAGQFLRFITEDARVKEAFPRAVTKGAFLEKFGNERLPDGGFVRDLLVTMPDKQRYASLDALASDLVDRESAALKTTEGAAAAVAASLGLSPAAGAIADAPIHEFGALPPRAREAFLRKGVDTLGKFAGMEVGAAQKLLKSEGITDVSAGDLAQAGGVAKALIKLR